jgi:hypothetical protein
MSDVAETPPPAPELVIPPLKARLARAALLLAVATVLALAGSALVLALVFRADFLTGAATSAAGLIHEHGVVAAFLASSPLLAAMLVGYGYMQRGIRRRAAEKAAAEAEAARST